MCRERTRPSRRDRSCSASTAEPSSEFRGDSSTPGGHCTPQRATGEFWRNVWWTQQSVVHFCPEFHTTVFSIQGGRPHSIRAWDSNLTRMVSLIQPDSRKNHRNILRSLCSRIYQSRPYHRARHIFYGLSVWSLTWLLLLMKTFSKPRNSRQQRTQPSKMFDVLKEDFDHVFISAVLVAMFAAAVITRRWSQVKQLNKAWKWTGDTATSLGKGIFIFEKPGWVWKAATGNGVPAWFDVFVRGVEEL